jgi:hypothetical protein
MDVNDGPQEGSLPCFGRDTVTEAAMRGILLVRCATQDGERIRGAKKVGASLF